MTAMTQTGNAIEPHSSSLCYVSYIILAMAIILDLHVNWECDYTVHHYGPTVRYGQLAEGQAVRLTDQDVPPEWQRKYA